MPNVHPSADQFPTALREVSRWMRLGPADTPAVVAHPTWSGEPVPLMIWIHGRTVHKELDPGRYLRWIRAGIGVCSVDLPGHGERLERSLQSQEATLEVVEGMVGEIDGIVDGALALGGFDEHAIGLGGMSAGGMATLARLCAPHRFAAASVEGTTGSWRWQRDRAMFQPERVSRFNPIEHLDDWREIPLQAIHARFDEWVAVDGQREFIEALRARYRDPALVEFEVFEERTGAPYEHAGFGRRAGEAKDLQIDFLRRALEPG